MKVKVSDAQLIVLNKLKQPYEHGRHHPQDAYKENTLGALLNKGLIEYYDIPQYLHGAVRLTAFGRDWMEEQETKNTTTYVRLQAKLINGEMIALDDIYKGLKKENVIQIWTVLDEETALKHAPYNPMTGEKVTSIEDVVLVHHYGVFLEDQIHDWNFRKNGTHLSMYSRAVKLGNPIHILLECEL